MIPGLSLEDNTGDPFREILWRYLRCLSFFWRRNALGKVNKNEEKIIIETHGNKVHFLGLPELGAEEDFIAEVQDQKYRDVDICRTSVNEISRGRRGSHAQAVRNPEALKSQKTENPLMRMKNSVQPAPQYAM